MRNAANRIAIEYQNTVIRPCFPFEINGNAFYAKFSNMRSTIQTIAVQNYHLTYGKVSAESVLRGGNGCVGDGLLGSRGLVIRRIILWMQCANVRLGRTENC